MTADIDNAIVSLTDQIKKLQQENHRLTEERGRVWKAESEASRLASELRECNKKLEKAMADAAQHRHDSCYWRQAVRYEQSLKKPSRRLRHVPIFNSVSRRKHTGGRFAPDWINAERVFLRQWRKENKPRYGGRAVLASILSENSNKHVADLTQRDATVAATVVQWLGTNCGQSFLYEVQRAIEQAKVKRKAAHATSALQKVGTP